MEKTTPYGIIPVTGTNKATERETSLVLRETAPAQETAPASRETALSLPPQRPPLKSRYYLAPAVQEVAHTIIAGYHPHLQEAAIAYLLRRGTWKSKGQVVTGKALTAPEQWRYLSGCDLVLIINETVWDVLEPKGREVLLDHELSHFTPPAADKNGNLRWSIREHDLQEFSAVVRRHGVCSGDHRRLIEAAGQLDLESLGALTTGDRGESLGGDEDINDDDCDNCFLEE